MGVEVGDVYCPIRDEKHIDTYSTFTDLPDNEFVVKYWEFMKQGIILIDDDTDGSVDGGGEDVGSDDGVDADNDVDDDDVDIDGDDDDDDDDTKAIRAQYEIIEHALVVANALQRQKSNKRTRDHVAMQRHIDDLEQTIKDNRIQYMTLSGEKTDAEVETDKAVKDLEECTDHVRLTESNIAAFDKNVRDLPSLREDVDSITATICCTVCQLPTLYVVHTMDSLMAAAKESPIVARCPNYHGMCLDCLDNCVGSAAQDGKNTKGVMCILESCALPFKPEEIEKSSMDVYTKYIVAMEEEEVTEQIFNGSIKEFKEKAVVLTPCCKTMIVDFDGCCSVQCKQCFTYFCGWCFEMFLDGNDGHEHLLSHCKVNPNGSLWPRTATDEKLINAVWQARQFQQLKETLDHHTI